MKLHDLRPAEGSHKARTRVGRGIAAGKGKTAGRGTKGQKARAGGSIPPWFEGGQTPLHMRIPKLRGFKNRAKIEYEVVNVGDISARVDAGAFASAGAAPKKGEPMTINADVLRAVGLVRNVKKPLKILGNGELAAALFVVADAFTKSATQKIEAAGGAVSILEVPAESLPAIGVGEPGAKPARVPRTAAGRVAADRRVEARAARETDATELAADAASASSAKAAAAATPSGAAPGKKRAPKAATAAAEEGPATAAAATPETAETAETPEASGATDSTDATESTESSPAEPEAATAEPSTETDDATEATPDESA
jgi:large subunit ribosomal protein L15